VCFTAAPQLLCWCQEFSRTEGSELLHGRIANCSKNEPKEHSPEAFNDCTVMCKRPSPEKMAGAEEGGEQSGAISPLSLLCERAGHKWDQSGVISPLRVPQTNNSRLQHSIDWRKGRERTSQSGERSLKSHLKEGHSKGAWRRQLLPWNQGFSPHFERGTQGASLF
jgi:hypothetical protein